MITKHTYGRISAKQLHAWYSLCLHARIIWKLKENGGDFAKQEDDFQTFKITGILSISNHFYQN